MPNPPVNRSKPVLAWHFTNGMKLRDDRELIVGHTYKHSGKIEPCVSGLHASIRPIDALKDAPGDTISRVECSGRIVEQGEPVDKLACSVRKVLWCADAEDVLRAFARRCASDVLHLWAAPQIVKDYLATGDESKRAAAWDAAWDVARDASLAAAWDAARDAARDAAWAAARAAARDVPWDAARDVARDASLAAARDAALDRYNSWLEESLMSLAPKAKKKARKKR